MRFECEFFRLSSLARRLYEGSGGSNQTTIANDTSQVSAPTQGSIQDSPINMQLPNIQLPNFDGDYNSWLFFKDTFVSIVHNNTRIPEVHKFHMLRLTLKGEAADVISSLEVCAANYKVAWNLIVERYENKPLMISNHVNALFNLSPAPKESHAALRSLLDNLSKHLRALEVLGQPVFSWDTLLIHLMNNKLDPQTRREWEAKNTAQKIPTIGEFTTFLKEKCRLLETLNFEKLTITPSKSQNAPKVKTHVATERRTCPLCKADHLIYSCADFIKLDEKSRFKEVKRLQLCINCLRPNHNVSSCNASCCRKCNKRHNTMLHLSASTASETNSPSKTHTVNAHSRTESYTFLPTACVNVQDSDGNLHSCRALLDSASQSSYISSDLVKRLHLVKTRTNISVLGVNEASSSVDFKTHITVSSLHTPYKIATPCLVVPIITDSLPSFKISRAQLKIPSDITLADPTFHQAGVIDLLLGADVFFDCLLAGRRKIGKEGPCYRETQFGWVAAGRSSKVGGNCEVFNSLLQDTDSSFDLRNFWQVEDCSPGSSPVDLEAKTCEDIFQATRLRTSEGRFVVTIPIKDPIDLGDSKTSAVKSFLSLESRLTRKPQLKADYSTFMAEYEKLGHMTRVSASDSDSAVYYLPHHCVIKDTSSTTRLRVVFNASAPSSNGLSLNDFQINGPVLQDDLFSILMRFRLHDYVLCGDIEKMYRQVLVHPTQRDLQRIIWRNQPTEPLSEFRLNTVTYGTRSASFLAVRSMHQLADDYRNRFPEACEVLLHDFYMDDLITSHDSIETLTQIKTNLSDILQQGCFNLRKLVSNSSELTGDLAEKDLATVSLGSDSTTKTLGLLWSSQHDVISYKDALVDPPKVLTKRIILSEVSRIFDPLGLLGPVVITAKIMLQGLWSLGIWWDELVPPDIERQYLRLRDDLSSVKDLQIKRQLLVSKPTRIELHVFADASEKAYGVAVYLKSINEQDEVAVNLACAKSRVAPIKTLTIPKLELCAAHLATRLALMVLDSLKFPVDFVNFWSDSTIVLAWVSTAPNKLKQFVANRVSEMQDLHFDHCWRHVSSPENPSDMLSRGVALSELKESQLWWHGPSWLSNSSDTWPSSQLQPPAVLPECKPATTNSFATFDYVDLFPHYSDLKKLQRIVARCLRFTTRARKKAEPFELQITTDELQLALTALIKSCQLKAFHLDIECLRKKGTVSSKSCLLSLNPYLDDQGVLRVGGRLNNADFDDLMKHPIILPFHHNLTKMIARDEHTRLLHAAPQALLASLRERYWPLRGRNLVKRTVRECLVCYRFNAKPVQYQMSSLPRDRLVPSRPFLTCGVDYGGPFLIRAAKGRNPKQSKAYVCLFICYVTRAIHLELVSDLTSQSFLAALRRFFSRRGKSHTIWSDNGTTFVGGFNEISRFLRENVTEIESALAHEGVRWRFITPRAPHWGGLWEAGIKATKYHIKRVVGDASLTYEEFTTFLNQVEACLNSRPLAPLSDNPSDLNPLTPAHFLIGTSLTALPEPDLTATRESLLNRYERVQLLLQHFWNRWKHEYLATLQQRLKWKEKHPELLQVGSLVILKDDATPPLQWPIGRVTELHTGVDGVTRAATVRTAAGEYRRPSTKICLIPSDANDEWSV